MSYSSSYTLHSFVMFLAACHLVIGDRFIGDILKNRVKNAVSNSNNTNNKLWMKYLEKYLEVTSMNVVRHTPGKWVIFSLVEYHKTNAKGKLLNTVFELCTKAHTTNQTEIFGSICTSAKYGEHAPVFDQCNDNRDSMLMRIRKCKYERIIVDEFLFIK